MKKILLSLVSAVIIASLFVGCSPNNSSSTTGANINIKDTITSVYNDKMNGADNWLTDTDQTALAQTYGMNFDNIEEFYGKVPMMNVHSTAVIGAKAKPGKASEVKKELEKYHTQTGKNFETYLPDQYEITKNAKYVEKGDYVFLVMSENVDDVYNAIQSKF